MLKAGPPHSQKTTKAALEREVANHGRRSGEDKANGKTWTNFEGHEIQRKRFTEKGERPVTTEKAKIGQRTQNGQRPPGL
jgi:hypothetical protein